MQNWKLVQQRRPSTHSAVVGQDSTGVVIGQTTRGMALVEQEPTAAAAARVVVEHTAAAGVDDAEEGQVLFTPPQCVHNYTTSAAAGGLDLIVHLGDLGYSRAFGRKWDITQAWYGREKQQTWDLFGHMISPLASTIPYMVAPGSCVVCVHVCVHVCVVCVRARMRVSE
jgi:hypothetical protein